MVLAKMVVKRVMKRPVKESTVDAMLSMWILGRG